jgi:2-dehydro-3-deoxygluconokinase
MLRLGPAKGFDVICAGEALWNVHERDGGLGDPTRVRLRPGGGAVDAALALAGEGLRVGLATVLADDTAGRRLVANIGARGVDTDGVVLSQPSSGLVFLSRIGGARQVVSFREEEQPISVPEPWSSHVLLLSGMSPIVAHGAALCRAARAARRAGTIVVVDVNARWHLWRGRDPRAIRMVVKEADVVWCSHQDLFGLNLDVPSLRAALRRDAALVLDDPTGGALAPSAFGSSAAAICAELARAGRTGETRSDLLARALERGRIVVAGHGRGPRR